MGQTHFLIPLRQVSKKCRNEYHRNRIPLTLSFATRNHEMECHYISIGSQDFYFRSFPESNLHAAYRKITAKAYLLGYRMHHSDKTEMFFLVVGVQVDKCFDESYADPTSAVNQDLPGRLCTDRDLIYLQKAFYDSSRTVAGNCDGLFYPLHSPTLNLQQWASRHVSDLGDKHAGQIRFEYSISDVLSIDVLLDGNYDEKELAKKVSEKYYVPCGKENVLGRDNLTFALCLLNGNINIDNVAPAEVEGYRSHATTNNRYEQTFVDKGGILLLRTHHPFDLDEKKEQQRIAGSLEYTLPEGLGKVQNLFELCSVLYAKRRLGKINSRMSKNDLRGTKRVLANMAHYLNMQQAHVASMDAKMAFIYEQMGVIAEFEALKQEGLLRSDAYNLKLSFFINVIGVVIAVVAFVLTAMQIIQNYKYNRLSMSKCNCTHDVVIREQPCPCVPDCCHDPIILGLCVLIALLVLLGLYYFVCWPLIRKIHRELHREMENEEI